MADMALALQALVMSGVSLTVEGLDHGLLVMDGEYMDLGSGM